jgi:hypothetical protein
VQSGNAAKPTYVDDSLAAESAPEDIPANSEMRDIFMADQAIRTEVEKRGGWIAVKNDKAFLEKWEREDSDRLKRTSALLELGALKSGIDFYRAAYVFQHSKKSEDFLKAHHLAVISISKGYDARWISAATLDRYLQAIGRQQIYGTQFMANEVGKYIRQPVESGIVSDAERAQLNVPALTEDW